MDAVKEKTISIPTIQQSLVRYSPPWLQGVVVFLLLSYLMGAWVHSAFQGHWWGPFLPGWQFGVPEKVHAEYGIFPTSHTGWDAQFYFYQANDLFALEDAAEHLDNPPYRYQRIGSPLLARIVSWVMGYKLVPPMVYHITQIAVVSIGYAFLVSALRQRGHSTLWALGWLCCDGVTNAIAFGMPDPVGDALFMVCAWGVINNRIWVYLPAAIFLPLVREPYALICGLTFVSTLFGWIGWGAQPGVGLVGRWLQVIFPAKGTRADGGIESASEPSPSFINKLLHWSRGFYQTQWQHALIALIPCLIVISWQLYVTKRFGITPSKAGNVMLDYPFFGSWKGLMMVINRHQKTEIVLHIFAVVLFIVCIITVLRNCKSSVLAMVCVPYLAILTCMSWVAWEDYSGYLKAMGTVIVLLLLFLPKKPNLIYYGLVMFLVIEGVYEGYNRKKRVMFEPYVHQTQKVDEKPIDPSGPANTGPLSEVKAVLEIRNEQALYEHMGSSYRGIWQRFHRDFGPKLNVHVTNTSNVAWEPLPRNGMYAVNLSFQWLDAKTKKIVLETTRVPIKGRIGPGESQDLEMLVAVPRSGKYLLKISMIQEGYAWFSDHCEQYLKEIEVP